MNTNIEIKATLGREIHEIKTVLSHERFVDKSRRGLSNFDRGDSFTFTNKNPLARLKFAREYNLFPNTYE